MTTVIELLYPNWETFFSLSLAKMAIRFTPNNQLGNSYTNHRNIKCERIWGIFASCDERLSWWELARWILSPSEAVGHRWLSLRAKCEHIELDYSDERGGKPMAQW